MIIGLHLVCRQIPGTCYPGFQFKRCKYLFYSKYLHLEFYKLHDLAAEELTMQGIAKRP
jgi:hypothetical protein